MQDIAVVEAPGSDITWDIAREALRRLRHRRLPPTPENYREACRELGAADEGAGNFPEPLLRVVADLLPRESEEQSRKARKYEQAVASRHWDVCQSLLAEIRDTQSQAMQPVWADLLRRMLLQWEIHHQWLSPARKRESLERILATPAADARVLYRRLLGLVRSWELTATVSADAIEGTEEPVLTEQSIVSVGSGPKRSPADTVIAGLADMLGDLLETASKARASENSAFADKAMSLAAAARTCTHPSAFEALKHQIQGFLMEVEVNQDEARAERHGLLKVLGLVVKNLGELSSDDAWLKGQMETLTEATRKTLSPRMLEEMELHLKEVIYRQSQLSSSLQASRDALRISGTTMTHNLGQIADRLGRFEKRAGQITETLKNIKLPPALAEMIEGFARESNGLHKAMRRSHNELTTVHERMSQAETSIHTLREALEDTSQRMRHDYLTGALNRAGFDEAIEAQAAHARQTRQPMALAILQARNFRPANDEGGAQSRAYIAFARILRDLLRPEDILARWRDDEFILLLPRTNAQRGVQTLERLQRHLTRRYFMHSGGKMLVTCNAGVAEFQTFEKHTDFLQRATRSLQLALRQGKNRVVSG